jgi:hypothetical protein
MEDTKPIYASDYTKYKNVSFSAVCKIESEFKKTYHTCPSLMEKKKILEKYVRKLKTNEKLTRHFKILYKNRKESFYQNIVDNNLVQEDTEIGKIILNLVKDILFIYSKKKEEAEYIEYFVNHLEAEISHREEMMESMIEDFRGCD